MDYHQHLKLSQSKLFERRLDQQFAFKLVLECALFGVQYLSLPFQTSQSYALVFQSDPRIQIHKQAPHFF
jgi:hypothetical protein